MAGCGLRCCCRFDWHHLHGIAITPCRRPHVHRYFWKQGFSVFFSKRKKKVFQNLKEFFFLISVSSDPKRCLHVDERPERIDKSAFSKIPVYCGCSLRWKQLHHTTLCVMSSEACSTGGFVHICTAESLWLHFCAGFQLCVQT